MNPIELFTEEVKQNIAGLEADTDLHSSTIDWIRNTSNHKYTYNFTWMGRPIIQFPQDMVAMQELIWQVRPDLIIETGIAHGGSLIMSASMLAMLDYCEAVEAGVALNPLTSRRKVLGIDIDIRSHNRAAIEAHPMSHRIEMIQGSSIAPEIVSKVHEFSKEYQRILICLDSNHTHEHVLAELEAYAPLTSKGSYCCVFDTMVEDMPEELFVDRPWGKGNNPKTAVWEYLRQLKTKSRKAVDGNVLQFEIDKSIENKLLITVAPDGYLRRVN